ncbi:MAG: dihydrodipicolinate synthase family protein, partial [Mesorhizobium sp.]
FDAIAPVANAALAKLADGDRAGYDALMAPTVPLSRKIFEAPTEYYKAGIVFMAWLNGHQDHFSMVGGMQSARGICHYADVFRLADQAGLLADPELAIARMKNLCAVAGV